MDSQVEVEAANTQFKSAEATFQACFRAHKAAKQEKSSATQHKVLITLLCILTLRSSTTHDAKQASRTCPLHDWFLPLLLAWSFPS